MYVFCRTYPVDSKYDKKWGYIPEYKPPDPRPNHPNTNRPRITTTTTTPERTTTPRTAVWWTTPITTTTTTSKTTTTPATTSTPTTTTTSKTRRKPVSDKPDFCNTTFDAVSIIRKDVFFFKGKYMWRLYNKELYTGYPTLISRQWGSLPEDMNQVDAVYERLDGKIVFFVG